jgi:DNA-binding XRE family transcriptional regulator
MTYGKAQNPAQDGKQSYERWKNSLLENPEYQAVYEEEAAKSELWLQLAEARHAAGLTQAELAERLGVSQAQVSRIEQQGYDAHTIRTLRRYVEALGEGFSLEVRITTPEETGHPHPSTPT